MAGKDRFYLVSLILKPTPRKFPPEAQRESRLKTFSGIILITRMIHFHTPLV
jgi:hypothetical protein